ncbi:hypothetical protein DID88_005769 [Monilinia fructigena]|uniref:1,3-beta-glucanosyltransferase n=1 Tax=Monilinia fructigena TaxID=38457 RepID=A0A395IDB4_9HELO|nr:hypothetical protein DID88_005769 [Monilinia fructigena]
MKTFNTIAALAAAGSVLGAPSQTENLAPRASSSSSLTAITTKGNASSKEITDSIFVESIINQEDLPNCRPYCERPLCERDIASSRTLVSTHRFLQLVYLQNIFATIDAFANYTNVLAFFSGNEVINDDTTTSAAPYVKAMAQYMNCGTDDERSDFFAFNDYSWCDPSSFTTSGWDQKVKNFTDYGIPIFLSEYGCNTNTRKFEEVASLYSTDMTGVYSGGLVYEYSEEGSKYGLVTISGGSVTEGDDFKALKSAFAKTSNPNGDGGYSSSNKASDCPAKSSTWNVTSDALPAIPSCAAALHEDRCW